MAERILSMAEAQQQFPDLARNFAQDADPIIITENDDRVLAILPFQQFQQMCETIASLNKTLEILHDEKFMTVFRMMHRGSQIDDLTSLDRVKQELSRYEE